MSWNRVLHCPHCGEEVHLELMKYGQIRPGSVFCQACGERLIIPLSVRLVALFVGLAAALVPLALLSHAGLLRLSTPGGIAFKAIAFLACVFLLLAVMSIVSRATIGRFEK